MHLALKARLGLRVIFRSLVLFQLPLRRMAVIGLLSFNAVILA